MKEFLIIDANNLIHRAYHGYGKVQAKREDFIVYGFDSLLNKLLDQFNPDYLAVVFDDDGDNFRHRLYKEYKANRPSSPAELKAQSIIIKSESKKQWPSFCIEDFEADDVIATLVKKAEAHGGLLTTIVSGDKDLAQLVSPKTILYNGQSKKFLDLDGVVEKFGVSSEFIVDYLAILGDTSDNVPGIDKCGPVAAKNLVNTFGHIENIIIEVDSIDSCIKPKTNLDVIKKQIREDSEKILLSKKLITLIDTVEMELKLGNLRYK